MAHLSEDSKRLNITQVFVKNSEALLNAAKNFADVVVLRLPACAPAEYSDRVLGVGDLIAEVAASLGPEATLITLGETIDLVEVQAKIDATKARYQTWIAIKRDTARGAEGSHGLPEHHFGALVHTRYKASLRHTKTRIEYAYCPACDKTTKDYGGKKHTYHEYGTLVSDVWRDITGDLEGDLTLVLDRFADLFGIEPYTELRVIDCRALNLKRAKARAAIPIPAHPNGDKELPQKQRSKLIKGDCLEELKKLPNNSVDFAFADPPYNLGKGYFGYSDDLTIAEYFEWCDKWITELARVLRPGRTCAVLNIPLWAVRHFLYMEKILNFQSWIVWDALSFPVRMIMPAHYAILCFSKGESRDLPGLVGTIGQICVLNSSNRDSLTPLADGYCLRAQCVAARNKTQLDDSGALTDLWGDVHRLKHNSRRVDHPCQLPPQLMYRLVSLYTKPGEVVLDCFNGAGTTTLAAHQLGRKYIGIESAEKYHKIAKERHEEVERGIDPFRKVDRVLTAKNSPVPRLLKQKYVVPKKALQLEVRRVARLLGRLPNREEMKEKGKYPIEYYDQYFASWGEVCAAARTTGMIETREKVGAQPALSEA